MIILVEVLQKMENNVKKLAMILEAVKHSGIRMTDLAEDIGVHSTSLYAWRTKKSVPVEAHRDKTLEVIGKRARYLSHCKVTNKSIHEILKLGVSLSSMVREGGPELTCRSKQDLHEKIGKGIENYPEVRQAIEDYLHGIGENLLKGLRSSSIR
jgi:hypothetical protein